MFQLKKVTACIPALVLAAVTSGSFLICAAAHADDAPPPSSAPGNGEHGDRHHNPAWAACKKQADDQKLQPGDARRDFMKTCMKSAKAATAAPATP